MKTKILFLSLSALFLSGCSLVSSSSDGGVFRSDDGGKTFTQKVKIDEKAGIGAVDVLNMAVNPQNGEEIYIGTKSSGIFKTADGGEKWQEVKVSSTTPGKAYALVFDSLDPRIIYAAVLVDNRGKIIKSQDAGSSWKDIYAEPSTGSFVLALALNPLDPKKIFAGTTKGQIIFSDNGGETWKNLYEAKSEVFKIAIDNFNPDVVFFAVFQRAPLRTRDGGKTFEDMSEKNIFNRETGLENTAAIVTDPNRENWVYFGTETGLFRSKDGGENWGLIKILNRPRENAIRGIAINPQNSDEIIYGASQAFYKSVDGGQSWASKQIGGSRTIEAVAYHKQNPGIIFAGMNKR